MTECKVCNKTFQNEKSYLRHEKTRLHLKNLSKRPINEEGARNEDDSQERNKLLREHLKALFKIVCLDVEERYMGLIDLHYDTEEGLEPVSQRIIRRLTKNVENHTRLEDKFYKHLQERYKI